MDLVPDVINKTLKKSKFDPKKIYKSLIKETDLNEENANLITSDVSRCIISIYNNISHITAPMIREIVNSVMLKLGFEKERLQYTRIGFPYYDLKKIFDEKDKTWITVRILEHLRFEYKGVKDLINTLKKEE